MSSGDPTHTESTAADPQASRLRVHLLDVGREKYGDSILIQLGGTVVLIDGAHTGDHDGSEGHDSIPAQLDDLLGHARPHAVDLLIISHAHEDHIGCLPRLVADGILEAKWALVPDPDMAWGRPVNDTPAFDAAADARVRQVVAGLREEARLDERDGRSIDAFLADAASLEDTYGKMLDQLEAAGTRVVRFAGPEDAELRPLLDAFASVGLQVLGPSLEQLLHCAHGLAGGLEDAVDAATLLFQGDDAPDDVVDAYLRLATGETDSVDATRLGNLVNLQSITTEFNFRGRRLLFAGDMQFVKPGTSAAAIKSGVSALRAGIAANSPYDFVKLSHHGAENACDQTFLDELGGTRLFGICAGEMSTKHPHPAVLELLDEQSPAVRWARTDRNGRTTVTFYPSQVRVRPEQGKLNDPDPNTADQAVPPGRAAVSRMAIAGGAGLTGRAASAGRIGSAMRAGSAEDLVEVTAWIPHVDTRVSIAVDVEPSPGGGREAAPRLRGRARRGRAEDLPEITIAAGRSLPRLLVVTSREALADNIGVSEAEDVLAAIRARGMALFDELPRSVRVDEAAPQVIARLRAEGNIEGVLLLGGYDVVPPLALDTVPAALRGDVEADDDADGFWVWSDEIYASLDDDDVADLPISRLPDGRSAQLVLAALATNATGSKRGRRGIRNIRRPFAESVYRALPGAQPLLRSEPATYDQRPPPDLDGDFVYLMLHGDDSDASRFWGEGTAGGNEALNVANLDALGSESGRVVFTGCCWGALIADPPAARARAGQPLAPKSPEASIALTFLGRGARAFIGCTGAHYSPTEAPFAYFGGPMHDAFWRACLAGKAPAIALHQAKRQYAREMPHGRSTPGSQAIESKILRQFTCLGLGF